MSIVDFELNGSHISGNIHDRGPIFVTAALSYAFFPKGDGPHYRKFDQGADVSGDLKLGSGGETLCRTMDVYFGGDIATGANRTTDIYIVAGISVGGAAVFRLYRLDTSDDSVTEVDIDSVGTSWGANYLTIVSGSDCSITMLEAGSLMAAYGDDNRGRAAFKSADNGDTWSPITSPYTGDHRIILLPNLHSADPEDAYAIQRYSTSDRIDVRKYDDSLNTWSLDKELTTSLAGDGSSQWRFSATYSWATGDLYIVHHENGGLGETSGFGDILFSKWDGTVETHLDPAIDGAGQGSAATVAIDRDQATGQLRIYRAAPDAGSARRIEYWPSDDDGLSFDGPFPLSTESAYGQVISIQHAINPLDGPAVSWGDTLSLEPIIFRAGPILAATPLREQRPPPGVYIHSGGNGIRIGQLFDLLAVDRAFSATMPHIAGDALVVVKKDEELLTTRRGDWRKGDFLVVISECYPRDWVGVITRVRQEGRDAPWQIHAKEFSHILAGRSLDFDASFAGPSGDVVERVLARANGSNYTTIEVGDILPGPNLRTGLELRDTAPFDALNSLADVTGYEWSVTHDVFRDHIDSVLNWGQVQGVDARRSGFALHETQRRTGVGNMDVLWHEEDFEVAAFLQIFMGGTTAPGATYASRPRAVHITTGLSGSADEFAGSGLLQRGSQAGLEQSRVRFEDVHDPSAPTASRPFGLTAPAEFDPRSPFGRTERFLYQEEGVSEDNASLAARITQERDAFFESTAVLIAFPVCDEWEWLAAGNVILCESQTLWGGFRGPIRIIGTRPAEWDGEIELAVVRLSDDDAELSMGGAS